MSSSSSSIPPPLVAQTMINNASILTNANATTTTTTTTNNNINNHAPPQQQQKQHSASKQTSIQLRNARSKDEGPTHWLERIRTVQLSTMTPEQREEIRRKTDEQAERYAKAKKLHAISHRTQNAKTTSYFAMDQNAVYRDRQNNVAMSAFSMQANQNNNNNNNNNNAPASAPQQQQQANVLMRQMDEDDEIIANSFAVPVLLSRQQQRQGQEAGAAPSRPMAMMMKNAIPVSAAREEKQMTTSYAWNQNQEAERERVTETEEQQALRGLQTEPKTDDERAAKFEVFEKFSNKMMAIRKDLDDTVAETVVELPPLPREAVKHSLKKLDSDNCRGIFDQSRFWFVHDMFLQASKNCDLMNSISDEIARKIRLVATNTQDECPICLMTFATENANVVVNHHNDNDNDNDQQKQDNDEEADPKVPAMLLSCCHKVCEECWKQWSELKQARVYCPLCRNEEFMKEVAAGGAEQGEDE